MRVLVMCPNIESRAEYLECSLQNLAESGLQIQRPQRRHRAHTGGLARRMAPLLQLNFGL